MTMQPVPDLTSLFQDSDLPTADLLNEKITTPINWLLGQSGVQGFDLTPLGRDNGLGRIILPFQGANGRPTAIAFVRTAGTDGEGAIILFNDDGDFAIATPDGVVHPLQVEDLTWPTGTAAGSIIYATATPHPAYPDRVAVATLPPGTGVLASQGGAPAWDSNYTPAGVDWAYSIPADIANAVTLWARTVAVRRRAGNVIAATPVMPHPGTVRIDIEATYKNDPANAPSTGGFIIPYINDQQVATANGGWSYNPSATETTVTNAEAVPFSRGDRVELRVQSGDFSNTVITMRGVVSPVPAALT